MTICRICKEDKPKILTAKCYFETEPESIQCICSDCFNSRTTTCPACLKEESLLDSIFTNGGLYIDKNGEVYHKKCFMKVFKWKTKW